MRSVDLKAGFGGALVALACLGLAACGGGSGGGGAPSPAPAPAPAPDPAPADRVTVSGKVTYDFVPAGLFGGLDYGRTEARPVRFAVVQFMDTATVDTGTVVARTTTDENGDYSLTLDANQSGFVRVRAELVQIQTLPSWEFQVVDNTDGDALYTLDGETLSTGTADSVRDLHAPSGWTGSSYGEERAAAPFAILDTIVIGRDYVLEAFPDAFFAPLDIHWSEKNVATFGEDGDPDTETGEIGTSFFSPSRGLFLLGAEDADTEEYDPHVILHEFAHYLEFRFSRSDNFGGPHALGDRLDLRVAFSEGWSTAFAGLALGDPVYRDAGGPGQGGAFAFNMEGGINGAPGWYSEQSVQEFIYDLVDTTIDGNDIFSYPFSTVWTAMTGPVATTRALTSIFPFLNGLKSDNVADQAALDLLAADQAIASITTDFGENETNDAGSPDVLPVYTEITVNGPPVNLCSTDEFSSPVTGSVNKLGSRRFIRFTPATAGIATITMTATSVPAGEYADPDFWVYRQGPVFVSEGPPSMVCEDIAAPGWDPSSCVESASVPVVASEHVLEVYEWTNADRLPDEFSPIGRTCFDVTVTQP